MTSKPLAPPEILNLADPDAKTYSEKYKTYVFRFWYNSDKRGGTWVYKNIPLTVDPVTGKELTITTAKNWIFKDFKEYAEFLDSGVMEALDSKLVEERVEMLTRHGEIALEMQDMALDHLRDGDEPMDNRTALALLTKGIDIEKESKGLPMKDLLRLQDKSDAEVVGLLRDFVAGSDILEIEPHDPDTEKETTA
jgi:hypothetical protein